MRPWNFLSGVLRAETLRSGLVGFSDGPGTVELNSASLVKPVCHKNKQNSDPCSLWGWGEPWLSADLVQARFLFSIGDLGRFCFWVEMFITVNATSGSPLVLVFSRLSFNMKKLNDDGCSIGEA